jgi:hypothetical protein
VSHKFSTPAGFFILMKRSIYSCHGFVRKSALTDFYPIIIDLLYSRADDFVAGEYTYDFSPLVIDSAFLQLIPAA